MTDYPNHQAFVPEKIFYSGNMKQLRIKAKRYQHILKFFLRDESKLFKITRIQEGVFSEAPQLFKPNKNKNSSAIKKNQNRQFNEMLKDLEEWRLVMSLPARSEKGGVETKEYRLTLSGKTIGLLVQYVMSKDKQQSFDKLFNIWRSYLEFTPSSLNTFCFNYITECRKVGLFEKFAELYINNMIYNNYSIQNEIELFTQMIFSRYEKSEPENDQLWDLWQQVLRAMSPYEYELLIHHLKIHIGRQIVRKVHDFSIYEEIRYDIRDEYDKTVIEGYCKNCSSEYIYLVITVFSYLIFLFTDNTKNIIHNYARNLKCKRCNGNNFEIMSI